MTDTITLETLRRAARALEKNRIDPVVLTKEQAEEANNIYAELGLELRVSAGDSVYMFPWSGWPLK